MSKRMMIVTGEASGDIYGSLLASEVKRMDPAVELMGVGGEAMRQAGVRVFLDSGEISVVGIWEAVVRIRSLHKAFNHVKSEIRALKPDLLVLIDYPGMNLRLARFARRMGIKVMYYISPQVWAWGRNRIKLIRANVDKMVVILPFEVEVYRREGIDATYVGHPLIDIVKTSLDRDAFLKRLGLSPSRRLVALLPGSRPQEIRQHIGPLIDTASILRERFADLDFIMVSLPSFEQMVADEIRKAGKEMAVTTELRYEAIAYSDLAIMCSGTVTLEAALLGTPMIVIYRLALLSWALGRMIIKVPYISLVNLVAREEIVPEFIQAAVNPSVLADEAARILGDESRRRNIIERLRQVKSQLGPGGATREAARVALSLV
jgi:lipid-A-disaccharide synthase